MSLFERTRCGVRLTPAGEQFLAEIAPVLEQFESARRSARAMRRAETGMVRIGILTSLAGGFLRQGRGDGQQGGDQTDSERMHLDKPR